MLSHQIQQWEQNLEKFNMDLFRMRCYLASLQGGELPNPKSLLAAAGRPSKMALGRLGIFSVSSFHALVSCKELKANSWVHFYPVFSPRRSAWHTWALSPLYPDPDPVRWMYWFLANYAEKDISFFAWKVLFNFLVVNRVGTLNWWIS